MSENNEDGKIPELEKDAAIGLLITVFEINDEKKLLNKALDDFSAVYGDGIPGWMQHLYDCLKNSGNNEIKLDVIKSYAEQNKMEIIYSSA